MHTCLHDARLKAAPTLILHATELGGEELDWISEYHPESKSKIRYIHNLTEIYCFNKMLEINIREYLKKELSDLMS